MSAVSSRLSSLGWSLDTPVTLSMSPTTRVALGSFWEYVGFLGNSMIFLLMGMRIAIGDLVDELAIDRARRRRRASPAARSSF